MHNEVWGCAEILPFSIALNTVLLYMNFTEKIENQIPDIRQVPPMQDTKKINAFW